MIAILPESNEYSGKADGRVIECVQFGESALTCCMIDSITKIKCRENGQFDESQFSRRGEGSQSTVEPSS